MLIRRRQQRYLVSFRYLENADMNKVDTITNVVIPTIQSHDLLSIQVLTLSAESNMLFNQGVIGTLGSQVYDARSTQNKTTSEGYLVDKEGNINFPVIGKIKLGGLTK